VSSDTIFAPATAPGRSGIAVVRVSGPSTLDVVRRLTAAVAPAPRRLAVRRILDPETGEVIDRGLIVWFPGPNSFTGEDVAEFHVHGSRAVMAALSGVLARRPDVRLAEPGEFTRRAFLHGRLDLTQVEAMADLIDAETEAQRRQAQRQLAGDLGQLYERWRSELVRALAHVEAEIDFSDEELDPALSGQVVARVEVIAAEIGRHLEDGRIGERTREGLAVAIVGAPNVGKSSLLNRLARRDVAIVAASAGTTRDVLDVHLDLGGYPVTVSDTAGLRESTDEVEREGIRRARRRAIDADIRLIVFDATAWPERDAESAAMIDERSLVVVNKSDLRALDSGEDWIAVSAATGAGIDLLVARLRRMVEDLMEEASESAPLTRLRHREALEACRTGLDRYRRVDEPELAAEELRQAVRALGRITGRVEVEDVLDAIFRDFCLGK
jgi:tRNA modification GTPase